MPDVKERAGLEVLYEGDGVVLMKNRSGEVFAEALPEEEDDKGALVRITTHKVGVLKIDMLSGIMEHFHDQSYPIHRGTAGFRVYPEQG